MEWKCITDRLEILRNSKTISESAYKTTYMFFEYSKNMIKENKIDAYTTLITHFAMYFNRFYKDEQLVEIDDNVKQSIVESPHFNQSKLFIDWFLDNYVENRDQITNAEYYYLLIHVINTFFNN